MEHTAKNAELSKLDIIKVVGEIVSEAGVKNSGGKDFIKHQVTHLKFLHREHNEKLKKKEKLMKKRSTPVAITVYRDNDIKNFEYHKELKFSDFSHNEWDELDVIILTKKNQCVGDLMNSLSNKYETLKGIAKTLGINESLPLPEQDPSLPLNRKRKAMDLEHETYIAGLCCNRTLPEGVKFKKNKVIEKPEHGLFFIDVFADPSFQRVSDIERLKLKLFWDTR
ncbi:hypothetical protein Tco_0399912 [Tanacetum coccineum]